MRRRGIVATAVAGVLLATGAAALAGGLPLTGGGSSLERRPENPFALPLIAVPDTPTARAAETVQGDARRRMRRIARTPQATWLLPEVYSADRVGDEVARIGQLAVRADAVALFVLYGISDRDCSGGYSAGGLPPQEYLAWARRALDAAPAGHAVFVIEPDALADAAGCAADVRTQRTRLLASVVDRAAHDDVAVYLDAGHSGWVDASTMADLLRQAGVARARGFSLDVANYRPTGGERRYGRRLVALLADAGIADRHFVIDVGRNGAPDAPADFCNPPGRALGVAPHGVDGDPSLDALLWIKPPAESDGTCQGGPPAGEIWVRRAVQMSRERDRLHP